MEFDKVKKHVKTKTKNYFHVGLFLSRKMTTLGIFFLLNQLLYKAQVVLSDASFELYSLKQ